jgi:hypothetical protein
MTVSFRARLTAAVAVVAASAVAVAASLTPPPVSGPITPHTIELTAAVGPMWQMPKPDILPTLPQEVQRGIVPSVGISLPTPNISTPAPAATNINQAIKNIYNAAEPWVRYGFELATYAAGWVPYVGWLSPQIMIFYNFGERIVRSITFNLDDWILGPVPFLQGLGNVARDSVNALVQLGIDEWNFWLPPLPPLPPLPFTAQTTTAQTANMTTTQQQPGQAPAELQSRSGPLKPPELGAKNRAGAPVAMPHRLVTLVEQPPDGVTAGVASPLTTVPKPAQDVSRAIPDKVPTPPPQNPTDGAVRKALAKPRVRLPMKPLALQTRLP